MTIFKVIGILILIGLAGWIIYSLSFGLLFHAPPPSLGIDASAVSSLVVPKSEFDAAMQLADDRIKSLDGNADFYALAENICKWLAVAASAVITLIGGFKGTHSVTGSGDTSVKLETLPTQYVRVVAILAAFSAVCVSVSAPLQVSKLEAVKKADDLHELRTSTRKNVLETKDFVEASEYLDNLKRKAAR